MSEFRKIPPYLINSSKPEKGDFPYGMELLSRSFFDKLRQKVLPKGMPYFEALLNSNSRDVFIGIYNLLPYITDDKLKTALGSQLLNSEKDQGFAKMYIAGHSDEPKHHRLYSGVSRKAMKDSAPDEKGIIKSVSIDKTGSELHLIGGEGVGKEIFRVIDENSYNAWLKAFKSNEVWEKAGFDYVPVEPILESKSGGLRSQKLKDGRMLVFTAVLGPNLYSFLRNKKNIKKRFLLQDTAKKIVQVLEKDLHITHGHEHGYNFCVKVVDGKPLVYLIDFDRAKINQDDQK